jgi:AraC-like DNA-binding protein
MGAIRITKPWGSLFWAPEWSPYQFKPQSMRSFSFKFIFSGRGRMQLGDQWVDLFPGCALCLRPGHAGYATSDPKRLLGDTFIPFDFLDRRGKLTIPDELPPHYVVLQEIDNYNGQTKRIVELMDTNHPECRAEANLLMESVLHAMRFCAAQPILNGAQREQNEAVNATQRYIRNNPGKLFSVAELADRVGYCPGYLTQLFRKFAGMTLKEFCIRVRLEKAQMLLSQTHLGIEQIATDLGYANAFFFSHQFKQRIGVSPARWRARLRE